MLKSVCAIILAAAALGATAANATTIVAASAGLTAPETIIGFDEVALTTGNTVTDQFAPFGVTFDPGVTYFSSVSTRPNFSGPAVLEFGTVDISIMFSERVSAMSAAMTANFGSMTLTALLNGVVVESFTHSFPLASVVPVGTNPNNFFGFSGIVFDEVVLSPNGSTTVAMDNLAFTLAPVPLPASLPLLLAGLCGLGLMARRRRAA
ncbi:hypothetical protein A8B78_20585 [Jannaschia sp. EhC01]|nr:hypothetical protein A8B78_20585 [Jannaschia sp. EhC01]